MFWIIYNKEEMNGKNISELHFLLPGLEVLAVKLLSHWGIRLKICVVSSENIFCRCGQVELSPILLIVQVGV
jgi:hypothetical protein